MEDKGNLKEKIRKSKLEKFYQLLNANLESTFTDTELEKLLAIIEDANCECGGDLEPFPLDFTSAEKVIDSLSQLYFE